MNVDFIVEIKFIPGFYYVKNFYIQKYKNIYYFSGNFFSIKKCYKVK